MTDVIYVCTACRTYSETRASLRHATRCPALTEGGPVPMRYSPHQHPIEAMLTEAARLHQVHPDQLLEVKWHRDSAEAMPTITIQTNTPFGKAHGVAWLRPA